MELTPVVEWHFGIDVPNAELSRVRTVADLAAVVVKHQGMQGRAMGYDIVLEEVRCVTAQEMRLPLHEVRSESEFVKDLGIG